MSKISLFSDNDRIIFNEQYHLFLRDKKYNNLYKNENLSFFWNLLRKNKKSFENFTDKQLHNKLISYRRLEGEFLWPNISKLDNYISPNAYQLVKKARESVLLAIDIYNRPTASFKSEGFIVMIIIAFTSLLHAIFEKKGIDYYHKDKNGNLVKIDNDNKAWELSDCLKVFYKNINSPEKINLEFLIKLRNKIEHRYAPDIDNLILGECQSALLNFDELIVKEFGVNFAIKDVLSIPLQTANIRNNKNLEVQKKLQKNHYEEIKEFVDTYRNGVEDEVFIDPKYSFKVFLIPKIGNHIKSSDLALEFVHFDPTKPEEMELYKKQIALLKEKKVPVLNLDGLKPKGVVNKLIDRGFKDFTVHLHTKAWKLYKVRNSEKNNINCNTKYCIFDNAHKDFIYTNDWVKFLSEKLKNPNEYKKLKES